MKSKEAKRKKEGKESTTTSQRGYILILISFMIMLSLACGIPFVLVAFLGQVVDKNIHEHNPSQLQTMELAALLENTIRLREDERTPSPTKEFDTLSSSPPLMYKKYVRKVMSTRKERQEFQQAQLKPFVTEQDSHRLDSVHTGSSYQTTTGDDDKEKDYVVKIIAASSLKDEVQDRMESTFPVADYVPALDKADIDLGLMRYSGTYDETIVGEKWCADEREVALTLSHRRALEKFLKEKESPVALILEEDTAPVSTGILHEIAELLMLAPNGWEFIELGRSWNSRCNDDEEKSTIKKVSLHRGSGFELSPHAYLITRDGAKKLLQYTLPAALPYNHTVMLLGRAGVLDEYFSSPSLFERTTEVLDSSECDSEKAKALIKEMVPDDSDLLTSILKSPIQDLINLKTRHLIDAPSPALAEVGRVQVMSNFCKDGRTQLCGSEVASKMQVTQNCRVLGGSLSKNTIPLSEPSRLFLEKLDAAGLDGVILWGLQPDEDHTHVYIHIAIYRAIEEAMNSSDRERHLCYVKETPGFHLGRDLYDDESRGMLGKSLVFASPKHMTYSNDPGFLTLPIETTSRYIFHGETPCPHSILKRMGMASEWEPWGPDGHVPIIDSHYFVRGDTWTPTPECAVDEKQKTIHCPPQRLIVQPWATEYTHDQIQSNKQRVVGVSRDDIAANLRFVGSIWPCNVQEFIDFTRGCSTLDINVVRLGQLTWIPEQSTEDDLTKLPNLSVETMAGHSKEDIFKDAVYAPAFQGSCHLMEDSPSQSYIADRILNVISLGIYPMTNNPSSFEYLGMSEAIVFNANVSALCGSMINHQSSRESMIDLMGSIASNHTYVSRLSTILDFLSDLKSSVSSISVEEEDNFLRELSSLLSPNHEAHLQVVSPTPPRIIVDMDKRLKGLYNNDECLTDDLGFRPVLDKISIASESSFGSSKILCFVNTYEENHTKARAIQETWGRKCDKLVFASSKTDESIGAIRIPDVNYTYYELWGKHKETLRYIYMTYKDEYDWFFKADDDTYVIMENLRAFLNDTDIQTRNRQGEPLYIGGDCAMDFNQDGVHDNGRKLDESILQDFLERTDYQPVFNFGGAGYALNHAFMENFMQWIDRKECASNSSLSTLLDDVMLGICSSYFGAFSYQPTRDSLGRERFHQEPPSSLYKAQAGDHFYNSMNWMKKYSGGFEGGKECCSAESISFHHIDPIGMHHMHNILYHCRETDEHHVETFSFITKPEEALELADSWPPADPIRRIADDQNRIIIMYVNCGMLDMADNFIASLLQFEVTNFVIIPRDRIAYTMLLQVYPDNVIPPMRGVDPSDPGFLSWKTKSYHEMNDIRPKLIKKVLDHGYSVLFTDVDVVWKSNAWDVLEEGLNSYQVDAILFEDNGYIQKAEYEKHEMSAAYLYIRPTPDNFALLYHWATSFEPGDDDQDAYNRALRKMPELSYHAFNSADGFPTGNEYFDLGQKEGVQWVHNNWIIGKWRKRMRFQENGLWNPSGRLDRRSYNCKEEKVEPIKTALPPVQPKLVPILQQTIHRNVTSPVQRHRTLVVLIGSARGGEPTWKSLYNNLLDANNADLALMLGTTSDHSSSLYSRAKYLWNFPEYDDWSKAIDDNFVSSEYDEHSWRRIFFSQHDTEAENPNVSGLIQWLAKSMVAGKLSSLGLLEVYDRFVVTRADQYYPCAMDLDDLDNSKIWIPNGEDYWGLCDRFVVSSAENILSVLNVLPPAIHHPENYYSFSGNPESFFKLRMKEGGIWDRIGRFRRTMFIASVDGDKTRWNAKEYRPAFVKDGITIHYKYEDEYYLAMTSCYAPGEVAIHTSDPPPSPNLASTQAVSSARDRDVDPRSDKGNIRLQDPGKGMKSGGKSKKKAREDRGEPKAVHNESAPKENAAIPHNTGAGQCSYHADFDELNKELIQSSVGVKELWSRASTKLLNTKDSETGEFSCESHWNMVVLHQTYKTVIFLAKCKGLSVEEAMERSDTNAYFPSILNFLANEGFIKDQIFGYIDDVGDTAPRILYLGDSISIGAYHQLKERLLSQGINPVHFAPTNCGGFEAYEDNLEVWLGRGNWDVIQFNVGYWFGNTSPEIYEEKLSKVFGRVKQHSPTAEIIFALTTPSPFDSPETTPDRATCPHFDKFIKKDGVHSLNEIAIHLADVYNATINDRYNLMLPDLEKYQNPCDIHYTDNGYERIGLNDWEVTSDVLRRINKA